MEGPLKSRCLGLLEVVWDSEEAQLAEQKTGMVTFIHKSVADFLETDVAKTRIMMVPGQDSFQPDTTLLRSILLQIKLSKLFLGREGVGLKRQEFLDHVRPLVCAFLGLAANLERKFQKAEVDLIDELRETVDALWCDVEFRSEDERE